MKNISLLYDEDCPLCRWYTRLFVKYGLLPATGRISYNQYVVLHPNEVDANVAQTKIACVNHQTNQVLYGIDGLVAILGSRFKIIAVLGNFKPINWLLKLLYLFISYNRRVVAPAAKREMECNCEPAKSIPWRIIFIVLISMLTSLNVNWFFHHFLSDYLISNPANDLILLGSQVCFQWVVFKLFGQENSYDYLGHLAFTSFLGSLILLFFGLVLQLLNLAGIETGFLAIISFGATLAFMFYEHKRRINLKGWSWKLTLSWILFRVLIYPFVFQL
ncbi:MAG: DCC1-like thiol-disulfide oxidoreductase family protein [Fluviicola sp.]